MCHTATGSSVSGKVDNALLQSSTGSQRVVSGGVTHAATGHDLSSLGNVAAERRQSTLTPPSEGFYLGDAAPFRLATIATAAATTATAIATATTAAATTTTAAAAHAVTHGSKASGISPAEEGVSNGARNRHTEIY